MVEAVAVVDAADDDDADGDDGVVAVVVAGATAFFSCAEASESESAKGIESETVIGKRANPSANGIASGTKANENVSYWDDVLLSSVVILTLSGTSIWTQKRTSIARAILNPTSI